MPLTSNGKIDKKSFNLYEGLELESGVEYIAPENKTEEKLATIFSEVLKTERIGIDDDLFALGGDSMKGSFKFR